MGMEMEMERTWFCTSFLQENPTWGSQLAQFLASKKSFDSFLTMNNQPCIVRISFIHPLLIFHQHQLDHKTKKRNDSLRCSLSLSHRTAPHRTTPHRKQP
jgi:hypothetical protein